MSRARVSLSVNSCSTVLVVDDDDESRHVLTAHLETAVATLGRWNPAAIR